MGEGLFIARMQLDVKDYQSPECSQQLTLPPPLDPVLKALQLTEALRAVLEGQGNEERQDALRKQVSDDTADIILKWLGRGGVSTDSQVCLSPIYNSYRTPHLACKSIAQYEIFTS